MTTNPEQTVPPLSGAMKSEMSRLRDALEDGAVVSLDEWAQIAVALGGRVEHLEEELREANDLCGQLDRRLDRMPDCQLVADGVLVEQECERCSGEGTEWGWKTFVPCPRCKGSGKDGTYRLVLPDGEEENDPDA